MADHSQRPHPRPPPSRRRDKAQLSCDSCRRRKYLLRIESCAAQHPLTFARRKCDRQQPCGTCSMRGLVNSCRYTTATSPSPLIAQHDELVAPRAPTSLHSRISELESLVVMLVNGPASPSRNPPRSGSPSSSAHVLPERAAGDSADPGTLKLRGSDSGANYIQSVHWEAILTKIRGLKEDFVINARLHPGSHLFYGPNCYATREEILTAVPSRLIVDRLLALHYDSGIITPYLLHSKKFLREYEAFWENPSATPIAWIGLMFSMLYIAAQLQATAIDFTSARSEYLTMKDAFRGKVVQCLILARYTTGGPYILETLITLLAGESILFKDGATDSGILISTILYLAMRMGYHRDPDNFPGISPFEAEMRRRIWHKVVQLDLTISLEKGLPRNAIDTRIDTKEPRNLRDCDFDEDSAKIPQPRLETECTPVLPLIARARLMTALGQICDINTDINPPSYDKVTKINALLENVHSCAIPPALRWKSIRPITDSPFLLLQRVSVETTYHKARILLYRKAFTRQSQERERESLRICLESALEILSLQHMLHEESQPFGRLCQLRWKVKHIFHQDVLLATSVLCLYFQDNSGSPDSAGQTTWSPRIEQIQRRLTTSHKIWSQMSASSAEAGKVARALAIVLGITEVSAAEDGGGPSSYDLSTDFGAMPLDDFGTTFNNEDFPSAFYAPVTFFDNVLQTSGNVNV